MTFLNHKNVVFLSIVNVLVLFVKLSLSQNMYDDRWSDNYNSRCPRLYPRNFIGYTPRGNFTAGNYTEKPKLKGLKQCVLGCCSVETCNVIFMHDSKCYHIECVSNELCLPLPRRHVESRITMVLVNPVLEEDNWQDVLDQANYGDDQILPSTTLEDEIINNLANVNQQESLMTDRNPIEMIKYKQPYSSDMQEPDIISHFSENMNSKDNFLNRPSGLSQFLDKTDQQMIMDASEYLTEKMSTCEVGIITTCPINEECVSILSKSRSGVCQCMKGFLRNFTGYCDRPSLVPYSSDIDINKVGEKETIYVSKEDNSNNKLKKDDLNIKPMAETSSESNIKKLTVSAISKEVRLPENEVTLFSYTIPDEKTHNDHYNYMWTLVEQPKGGFTGNMKGQNGAAVTLSQLTEGNYRFKVTVTSSVTNSIGEAYANVTVLPANRMNKPPIVVITPSSQNVKLPNNIAVLDGSDSKDDDAIISWRWELTSGPLGYQPPVFDGPTFELKDLKLPGNYTFRLTVEDSDHVKNSTTANITVLNHTDYPPEANAGQDIIIYLPTNNLTLNGSLSTDDHEITTWEWTKSSQDQNKAVDMQNTHSPYLQLSNLSEGVYTFVLKVTDSSGQFSTAEVHVFVKPPTNNPPVAKAGKHQYISLPLTWVTLNGSESTDDHRIVAYAWKMLKGPNNATFTHFNESITNLTSLTKGDYEIQLTVLDDNGNSATDTVGVTVTQNKNAPPKANAGGDQTIILPVSVMILNGSQSQDDLRIVKWLWTRQATGLAAGKVVGNSDEQTVLMLTDIVPGRYVFSLSVWDDQGLTSSDTVSINVKPDPNRKNLVQLTLNIPASILTFGKISSMEQKLGFLLGETYNINISDIRADQLTTKAQVIFFVTDKKNPTSYMPGPEVVLQLKSKLRRDAGLLDLSVALIDTVVCQNNCSGHGVCNEPTRQCHCEAFWMENIFTSFIEDMESNCDWSILYVVIGGLLTALCIIGPIWGLCCLIQKLCSRKSTVHRRIARYTLLGGGDEEETTRFTPSKMSVSDTDTDSDVLFESRNKSSSLSGRFSNGDTLRSNGHSNKNGGRNGFLKSGRRIKT